LSPEFPTLVQAVACDLDRTLIWEDLQLRPRTKAALAAAHAVGIHTIVVTGRMFRSVRPYLAEAGIEDLVVCYQGAVVADPVSGRFLRHVPIPLPLALEAIAAVEEEGLHLNCYVDDELFVETVTPEARRYADFQRLTINPVGDLRTWLERPPTKLVVIGDPQLLDGLGLRLRARFGERLFISKSLPYFLELASPDVSKGTGISFVAERLGFGPESTIAFGDGENDAELLDWAGFAIAVANAHPSVLARADYVCPSAAEEGVAQTIEQLLAAGVETPA
jgi:Cof subfamily protein (haloacid dehalogenase superfamily)